jgi:hypothetical protein
MIDDFDIDILKSLRFNTGKHRHHGKWGERRSTRRGEGIEFADYRDYAPGDDPRSIDWNLYARLDRPYVRIYEEDEDLLIAILADGSASMTWAGQSTTKWSIAQKLIIALGGIALFNNDVLYGDVLYKTDALVPWGPYRGQQYFTVWQKWVKKLIITQSIKQAQTSKYFIVNSKRPALVILVTDGYDVKRLATGIAQLSSQGHEIVMLHILSSDELTPSLHGDLRLVDIETDELREIHIDAVTLKNYDRKLMNWCNNLREICIKYNGKYVFIQADLPIRRLILEDLRSADVLR